MNISQQVGEDKKSQWTSVLWPLAYEIPGKLHEFCFFFILENKDSVCFPHQIRINTHIRTCVHAHTHTHICWALFVYKKNSCVSARGKMCKVTSLMSVKRSLHNTRQTKEAHTEKTPLFILLSEGAVLAHSPCITILLETEQNC